jgi:hypothetical protein
VLFGEQGEGEPGFEPHGTSVWQTGSMREELFAPCWHRWNRADEHRSSLASIWNDYIAEHPYDFSLVGMNNGTYVLHLWHEAPMPPEFAVTMGDWLYNIRSTLDYLIWATAAYASGENPPPNDDRLQYPIYDSERAWRNNLYRLEPLAEHHREMLHIMQPFASDADANFLGWINRLARIDRHRRLVDGTAYLAEIEPVVQVPSGSSVRFEWGERVLTHGRAEVARITVSPWAEGMEVAVNPRVGIDPEVAEWSKSPSWGRIRFADRLRMMQVFVAGEMAAYEYDCTGRSRKADLLTDDFRRQADSRPRRRVVSQPPRSSVDWMDAGPGNPSSVTRFLGEDFPVGPASASAQEQETALLGDSIDDGEDSPQ